IILAQSFMSCAVLPSDLGLPLIKIVLGMNPPLQGIIEPHILARKARVGTFRMRPQSADSGGVLGNLGESARELILKRLSSREWACHYGWSKRQAATSGCAVRRMKTLRADFRKGGCKNPLITMTLGAGGFK